MIPILYPSRPRIPEPVDPLSQGLGGLMQGWEQGRKTFKDNQAIDAAYGVYQNAPGQKPLDLSALGGMGGGFSGGGVASSVGAPAGQTVGGSTPSTALSGDSGKIYGDFIGTVKAGDPSLGLAGVTNPYGLAAVASTGKAESGYSPGNIHRQWSDPSESGKAGTAGGVMSWRAERLQNMRSFASKVGDNPNAPSAATQAKFFLSEDPSLVAKLNSARSPEEAQQLMNRAWAFAGYDRPGGEAGRRIAMARSYAAEFGRGGGAQQAIEAIAPQAAAPQAAAPVQVASNDPQAGMASALAYSPSGPSPEAGVRVPTPTARPGQTAPMPTPRPEDQTYTMASATAPGNAPAAAPAGGMDIGRIVSSVTQGQTNGANLTREQFAAMMQSDATKPLAMALFQSKVTGDPRAGERALELALRLENMQYERGMDQQRFGLQQEQTAWQRQQAQIAASTAAEERQYDRARDATADARAGRPAITSIYDEQGREQKGYFDQNNQFVPVGGAKAEKADGGITIGPDGTVQIGGSGMKLTEGQSKDLNYYVRGNAALPTIDAHEGALASGTQKLANGVPVAGNYLTSPEYQVANQAGREFLASILRKDTGAAITKEEEAYYGQMFLPQPGDAPEVLAQKRASRSRALEAMKSGLGTATPLASTPVTQNPTGSLVPGSDAAPQAPQAPRAPVAAPAAGAVEDGYRFKGGDPANPANWEPYT